jgi:hypothetical protein
MRKHHDREGAEPVIFAKVEVVNSLLAFLNANYFSGDALGFIEVIACLIKGNAGSHGQSWKK